jgi:signal transduction histidine kinase
VGRLASGIAHEIRNPLNFMNLSIDHLQSRFIAPPRSNHEAESVRNEAAHILGLIKDEIGRLNRLVSDFLSYGRPAKLKLKEINARSLVEEVIGLVRTQAAQQGVQITLDAPPNGDAQLEADPEQIKTCFSNLIINAVQAMPAGGALKVAVTSDDTKLHFEFQDTGCGIDADPLEQIFEPYYSTKETGIGLGLPLTKKLIEDHGGAIKVTSVLDQGTTFVVTLPRHAVQNSEDTDANSSASVVE